MHAAFSKNSPNDATPVEDVGMRSLYRAYAAPGKMAGLAGYLLSV